MSIAIVIARMSTFIARMSAFAVAASIVFCFSVYRHLPDFALKIKEALNLRVEVPSVQWVIVVFHFALAVRLYLHAWAVEESPVFRQLSRTPGGFWKTVRTYCDWVIRGMWIVLVMFLPESYSTIEANHIVPLFSSIEMHLLVIFVLLVVWDVLMFNVVMNASQPLAYVQRMKIKFGSESYAKYSLRFWWLLCDVFLLALAVVAYLVIQTTWAADWPDFWKGGLYILLVGSGGSICLVQVFGLWARELFHS